MNRDNTDLLAADLTGNILKASYLCSTNNRGEIGDEHIHAQIIIIKLPKKLPKKLLPEPLCNNRARQPARSSMLTAHKVRAAVKIPDPVGALQPAPPAPCTTMHAVRTPLVGPPLRNGSRILRYLAHSRQPHWSEVGHYFEICAFSNSRRWISWCLVACCTAP